MSRETYLEALAFLSDPSRVSWVPGKEPSAEEKEAMARRAARSTYGCGAWFYLPRRYPTARAARPVVT